MENNKDKKLTRYAIVVKEYLQAKKEFISSDNKTTEKAYKRARQRHSRWRNILLKEGVELKELDMSFAMAAEEFINN